MKNTLRSKTITASLEASADHIFARIAEPHQLSAWHTAFCRSIRQENNGYIVESPRGLVPIRFLRDDFARVLDMVMTLADGVELHTSIRVLTHGMGSEFVLTLIQPKGLADAAFHEHVRWTENAVRNLRKAPVASTPSIDIPAATPNSIVIAETPVVESAAVPAGQKLFIGNLPFDWSEDLLRAHFADLGTLVNVTIARFRNHGRSRGFGFVEMGSEEEARNAIGKLHESLAGGRKIIVRVAHTKDSRPEKMPEPAQTPAEAQAPVAKSHTPRPSQTRRPRDTQRAPALARRSRSTLPRAPRPSQDIQNKSGYEYFPRRAPGSPPPAESQQSQPEPRREPVREASPYFDDAQDVRQPPRRRGR